MKRGGLRGKRSGCTFRLFQGAFLIFALVLFRHELGRIVMYLRALGNLVLDVPVQLPEADLLLRESLYITLNFVSYMFFGYMLVYLISGSIFPLQPGVGRWEIIKRFNSFFFGARRPVIRVRDAQLGRDLPPGETVRGGIAIIDANSAIVLEKFSSSKDDPPPVGRPGVRLISPVERLHSIVSLRKQVRVNKDVTAQTIDGIEVKTNVSAVFTLGQPAAVIKVAYDGDPLAANLRVLQIDEKSKQITALTDELDIEDKREIHAYAQQFVTFNEKSGTLEPADQGKDYPPYEVDEDRIRAAAFAQARNPFQDKVDSWTDLPAQVATEVFRNLLAKERYDSLFVADTSDMYALEQKPPGRFSLLEDLKPAFSRRMRYQGVVSFQFLQHISGRPPAEGLRVDRQRFRISPVQKLRNPRLLRNLGIKVLAAGFSELVPNPKIYAQRLDNWRARKQQQLDIQRAEIDREVMRIKSKARIEAQKELIKELNVLLVNNNTEDALTWAIFQSLDEMASKPGTRQLLSSDTLKMMRDVTTTLATNAGHNALDSGQGADDALPIPPPDDAAASSEETES